MGKICHICGVDLARMDTGEEFKKNDSFSGSEGRGSVWFCRDCNMKCGQESLRQDSLTPYVTPMISPTISLSSSDSFVSSCSELLVDEQLQGREDEDEGAVGTSQECVHPKFSIPTKGVDRSGLLNMEILDDGSCGLEETSVDNNALKDVSNTKACINPGGGNHGSNSDTQSCTSLEEGALHYYSSTIDTDSHVWLPPEPMDLEDDLEGSVANSDDDDECSDGTKWGQPSSLGRFSGKHHETFRFNEERQKAMAGVMHKEFKNLVSLLLTLVGIPLSGEAGEDWVDIVTSLAWKAALLVKLDDIEGKALDPEGCVKVKCISTGRRFDSQLIKGLVFKKNAALKHMPTKYKNPRLMLLQGMVGQSSSGLLSFNSMEQEIDSVKSLVEMIGMCHPNVVLVEKTVSRDVQEALLGKGITVVFDMKLHRLERIARCTGSQIISSAENLLCQKLKQCKLVQFHKFVEEHNISKEGGKRMTKTLMFLEGCPRPFGCTVLLKGAHTDELKKVKRVVSFAVVMAYRLILDTSFLVGQKAVFSSTHSGLFDGSRKDEQPALVGSVPSAPCLEEISSLNASSLSKGIPIAGDEFPEISANNIIYQTSNLGLQGNLVLSASSAADIHLSEDGIVESASTSRNWPAEGNCHQLGNSHEPVFPNIHRDPFLSLLSTSLKKVLGDSLYLVSSASLRYFPACFCCNELQADCQNKAILPVYTSSNSSTSCQIEANHKVQGFQLLNDKKTKSFSVLMEFPLEQCKYNADDGELLVNNDFSKVLEDQSILFLMSSQNVSRGAICKQTHVCRVKYYRNFDVSLGWYLCNNLLDQRQQCSLCADPPEAHAYNYVNQRGKLTVQVKKISEEIHLPGEEERKLWMWARCSKCAPMSQNQRDVRRVVMHIAAHSLSFGKFLELSFSIYSISNMLSSCGHSLQDYLLFYGLGSKVAMFKYSPVNMYIASMPPPVMEFNNQFGQDFVRKEAECVLQKGILLFTEVKSTLQKIGSGILSSSSKTCTNPTSSLKEVTELEEMLKKEKSDFEAHIRNIIHCNEPRGHGVYELLSLNRLIQDLVLQSYIWDQRLFFHLSCDLKNVNSEAIDGVHEEQAQSHLQKDEVASSRIEDEDTSSHDREEISNESAATLIDPIKDATHCRNSEKELEIMLDETSADNDENTRKKTHISELQVSGSVSPDNPLNNSIAAEANGRPAIGTLFMDGSSIYERIVSTMSHRLHEDSVAELSSNVLSHATCKLPLHDETGQEQFLPIYEPLQVERSIPHPEELLTDSDSAANSYIEGSTLGEISSNSLPQGLETNISASGTSLQSGLADSGGWIWAPFPEISRAYRKKFLTGFQHNYDVISGYRPRILSSAFHLINEEEYGLHIPLGHEDNIVSSYESEPTSIIACALALSHYRHITVKDLVVEDAKEEKGENNKAIGIAESVTSDACMLSPYWSSNDSLDSEGIRSRESISTEESYTSSLDEFNLVDSLLSSEDLHPEIHLGTGKINGKTKYSVVCVYAKLFHALRRRCCPLEVDYIASLSRCKHWDAKGGKSGSFFVKTLDDRFIVKQIKKTEFQSFIKFAPDYFKYINQSLCSGSQTCLAKILGIYQVTVRQSRSGKDLKYNLMVMENLLFGRNVERLYDLKGAQHARYTSNSDGTGKVLLDQNFVEDMNNSPFYVSGRTKHLLQRAVWNDTSFLTSINVMDYSLLVGVDMQRCEFVCGIIDYLRQYTWDKHLETWVKASLVVPKNVSPTVVSPKEYKKRFRKFMSMYFFSIPDHCCQEKSSGHCKVCGAVSGESSSLRKPEQGEI